MDAHEAEGMANSMTRNSPLPDAERSDKKLPEEEGEKLPEEGGGEKLPEEGGGEKLPEETPTGKLIMPFTEGVLPFVFPLVWFYNQIFPLDSQNPGNTVGRSEDALHTESVFVVQATTSLVSSGCALPQVKLKLAHKLLIVSSRITRVLVFLLDRVVDTDLLFLCFWQ